MVDVRNVHFVSFITPKYARSIQSGRVRTIGGLHFQSANCLKAFAQSGSTSRPGKKATP